MQTLQSLPGMRWVTRHPRLTAWLVLAAGMLLFLFIEGSDIGLTAGNWIALIIATVLVAGLCVWIVSWEDGNETDATITPAATATNGPDQPAVESAAEAAATPPESSTETLP